MGKTGPQWTVVFHLEAVVIFIKVFPDRLRAEGMDFLYKKKSSPETLLCEYAEGNFVSLAAFGINFCWKSRKFTKYSEAQPKNTCDKPGLTKHLNKLVKSYI